MDELKKGLKNVSLYDVKAYVRKAQNVVYNYTEMEARVREATNNEPWGASSTLMQKIAAGTYNLREREEILGMICRRFTEKAANEWRQIYKSLQLLEYLVKNGSESFVDDTRRVISLIEQLRSFHYIDSQGRDQGINVRTKTKSLVQLLKNDSQLRAERKKSRENAKKFQGVAGGISSNGAASIDYDEYGTYEGRIFGDGGVYGQRFEESRAAGKNDYEEYDADEPSASSASRPQRTVSQQRSVARKAGNSKPVPVRPKEPEVDLFSFDEPTTSAPSNNNNNGKENDDFDEFGDFQSSAQTSSSAAPQQSLNNNLASLYHQQQSAVTPTADNTFGEFTSFNSAAPQTTAPANYSSFSSGPAVQQPKQDAFSSLFQAASSKAHTTPTKPSVQPSYSSQSIPSTNHTATNTSTQSQTATPSNGEIDLLDL